MQNKIKLGLLLICLTAGLLACVKTTPKILVISSYHPEYSWVQEEEKGFHEILQVQKIEAKIEYFYMDSKRNTDLKWIETKAKEAQTKIEEFKPDIVVVFDDNATSYVATKYIGKKIPFVFSGVNADPKEYGLPSQNITGVIERHPILDAINLVMQLDPKIKKVAIITDDSNSSWGHFTYYKTLKFPVEIVELCATDNFEGWKQKIRQYQTKVDAIGFIEYHTLKDPSFKQSLPPKEVIDWTLKNNRLPEFTTLDFAVKDGALCGDTVSGVFQGKAAAELVASILKGKKPSELPLLCPAEGKKVVNQKRAKELKIQVPIEFREK